MIDSSLEKYSTQAIEAGVTNVKQIDPNTIITAAWVRMKCQYGCPFQGYSYCCPPDSPTPEQTQAVINCYTRALLFHVNAPDNEERDPKSKKISQLLIKIEGDMFKDGFYKAFLFGYGPCSICPVCKKLTNEPCQAGDKKRPSMEAAGIDVYQTARNSGLPIEPLKDVTDTQNLYALILVD